MPVRQTNTYVLGSIGSLEYAKNGLKEEIAADNMICEMGRVHKQHMAIQYT